MGCGPCAGDGRKKRYNATPTRRHVELPHGEPTAPEGSAAWLLREPPPTPRGVPKVRGLLRPRVDPGAQPMYRWGRVRRGDVGTVAHVAMGECRAHFPQHHSWRAHLSDVEAFHPGAPPPTLRVAGAPHRGPLSVINGEWTLAPESEGVRWAGTTGELWRGWVRIEPLLSTQVVQHRLVELVPPVLSDVDVGYHGMEYLTVPQRGQVRDVHLPDYIRVDFVDPRLGSRKVSVPWWDDPMTLAHGIDSPVSPLWYRRWEPSAEGDGGSSRGSQASLAKEESADDIIARAKEMQKKPKSPKKKLPPATYWLSSSLRPCGPPVLQAKRIEFRGSVREEKGIECIASFPGKYSDGWEKVVDESAHDQTLMAGDDVTVLRAFRTDDKVPVVVQKGCTGKVLGIEEESDTSQGRPGPGQARVQFEGVAEEHWVDIYNFRNLRTENMSIACVFFPECMKDSGFGEHTLDPESRQIGVRWADAEPGLVVKLIPKEADDSRRFSAKIIRREDQGVKALKTSDKGVFWQGDIGGFVWEKGGKQLKITWPSGQVTRESWPTSDDFELVQKPKRDWVIVLKWDTPADGGPPDSLELPSQQEVPYEWWEGDGRTNSVKPYGKPITESCYCKMLYGKRDRRSFGFFARSEDGRTGEYESAAEAEAAWKLNDYRPVWGCKWFSIWRQNIEAARRLGQKLVVYFMPGQVGVGKVEWANLRYHRTHLWDGVGLGGSQKGEVAFLEKMGWEYEARDVGDLIGREAGAAAGFIGAEEDARDPALRPGDVVGVALRHDLAYDERGRVREQRVTALRDGHTLPTWAAPDGRKGQWDGTGWTGLDPTLAAKGGTLGGVPPPPAHEWVVTRHPDPPEHAGAEVDDEDAAVMALFAGAEAAAEREPTTEIVRSTACHHAVLPHHCRWPEDGRSGDERPLPFAKAKARMDVTLAPAGLSAEQRYCGTVVRREAEEVIVLWNDSQSGGPPPNLYIPREHAQPRAWWEGDGRAVRGKSKWRLRVGPPRSTRRSTAASGAGRSDARGTGSVRFSVGEGEEGEEGAERADKAAEALHAALSADDEAERGAAVTAALDQVQSDEEWAEVQRAFAELHPEAASSERPGSSGGLRGALAEALGAGELDAAVAALGGRGVRWDAGFTQGDTDVVALCCVAVCGAAIVTERVLLICATYDDEERAAGAGAGLKAEM